MSDVKLTEKQKLFCKEYIIDFNATRAAKAAGYSEDSAKEIGYENLTKPYIQDYIAKLTQKTFDKLEITKERVLNEIARIAFADPRDLMSWDAESVTLKDSSELTDDQAACVSEVTYKKTKEGEHISLKTHDKQAALDKLMRYQNLYKDVGTSENPLTIVEKPDFSLLSDEDIERAIRIHRQSSTANNSSNQ